jgi:hypothetical protein
MLIFATQASHGDAHKACCAIGMALSSFETRAEQDCISKHNVGECTHPAKLLLFLIIIFANKPNFSLLFRRAEKKSSLLAWSHRLHLRQTIQVVYVWRATRNQNHNFLRLDCWTAEFPVI